jgi:nucleoside-diphosphate-sugar epimerase
MIILVTGSTGFIGRALIHHLAERTNYEVRAASRTVETKPLCGIEYLALPSMGPYAKFESLLNGVDVVVHLAARVHVMSDQVKDPMAAFREVNTEGTLTLARQAADAGVKRFVFISSIKVNGTESIADSAYRYNDIPTPQDPYGISKSEAEAGLQVIRDTTSLEVVIVRPPLVYGPHVKANFASLMRAIYLGLPLPLGSVEDNRRSFLALDNLTDLLATCIDHPKAANQIFLASDGEDLSTADLIRRLARAMNRTARLIPVPIPLLRAGAAILGRRDQAQQLLGNLQLDIEHTCNTLNWTPLISVDDGLKRAAKELYV